MIISFDDGGNPCFHPCGLYRVSNVAQFAEWYHKRFIYSAYDGLLESVTYFGLNERLYDDEPVLTLAAPLGFVISVIPKRFVIKVAEWKSTIQEN